MAMHNNESVAQARERIAAAVAAADERARRKGVRVHAGRNNRKVGAAVAEGTSPLLTCSPAACASCGRECYALWHCDNLYTACRENHADNTIARRVDPVAYYERFFAAAVAEGVDVLRVNESGDFEAAAQVRALGLVAARWPRVCVIGYTRRPELIEEVRRLPANCHIRYSLYRDGDPCGDTIRRINCASVSATDTTCPAQIAADHGRRWTCADCARHGCGCASGRALVIFRAH